MAGEPELEAQLSNLLVNSWRYDDESDAWTVSVRGGRELDIVETRVIGAKYGRTVPLDELVGIVNIDLDNFERIAGIEVIGRPDLMEGLDKHAL